MDTTLRSREFEDGVVLSDEEYVGFMEDMHNLALSLLSAQREIDQKTIRDQAMFVQVMIKVLKEDLVTFSYEEVQRLLPFNNSWMALYLEALPLLDSFTMDEQTLGLSYHA